MKNICAVLLISISFCVQGQNFDVYGPKPFDKILEDGFAAQWTPEAISGIENLKHVILLDKATKSTAVMLDDSDISVLHVTNISNITGDNATYSSVLRSMYQIVDNNSNTTESLPGEYRIHPLLRSYHALDGTSSAEIASVDMSWFYLNESSTAYLTFELVGSGSFNVNTSGITQLMLIDVSGAIVDKKTVTGDETKFDLKPHVKGIFILKRQGLKTSFVRRLVVK